MPDCTADGTRLSEPGRRTAETTFNGGAITSDSGAVLLREADRQNQLTGLGARPLVDSRDPRHIHHSTPTLTHQRVFWIALAYALINTIRTMAPASPRLARYPARACLQ